MPLRIVVSIVAGILMSFFLFWGMQALINVTGKLEEGRPDPRVEFVRLRKDSAPAMKEREPPKREKPQQPPPPPQMSMSQTINPGEAVSEISPMVDTSAEIAEAASLGGGGSDDRDVVPLVRVDPDYPPTALQRRIEGYVDLEFTIGPAGSVEDARVIKARPPSVFDQAALRAVRRWRYNPRVEDGAAVSRPGVRVRLTFKLPG